MAKGTPVARLSVRVLPDTSEFGPKLKASLSKVGDFKINVDPDLTGFAAKIKAEAAKVRDVKVGVDFDTHSMAASHAELQAEASRNPVQVPVELDRKTFRNSITRLTTSDGRGLTDKISSWVSSGISKGLGLTGSLVKFAGIGMLGATAAAGVGALLLKVVPLVGEIGQLAGLLPLVPAGLAGIAGIAGTVVLGLHGMSDAFKNMGDPKKFAESLKGLSPAAQSFAKAAKSLKDSFTGLQLDVQEKLFSGLGAELKTWKTDLVPALASGFGNIATGLNAVAKNAIAAFGNSKVASAIRALFGNTGSALSTAAPGLGSIITGFSTLSASASKFFDRFANAFVDAGGKFEAWVDKITTNGQLDKWIEAGIAQFKNIAGIARNLGSVIASVTRAAGGEGLLAGFNNLTESFARWAKSDTGERVINHAFDTADKVLSALGPIIPALSGFSTALNLGGIAEKVGPQVANIINALKPAASSLGSLLADLATPLGKALTSFATFIGPAIDALSPGLKDLFNSLPNIAPDLGGILVDVGKFGSAIGTFLSKTLPPFISAVKSIADKIVSIVGSLGDFGGGIAAAVAALAIFSGGGKGGKGFSLGKTLIGGGVLVGAAVNDDATKSAGAFATNVASAAAAGALLGSQFGILGTVIGGLAGGVVGMVPTFKKAVSTLFTTITGGKGDKFTLDPNAPFGIATQVTGKATNANTEAEKAQIKARLALNKQNNKDLQALYSQDASAYADIMAEKLKFDSKYNTASLTGALKLANDIRVAQEDANAKKIRGDQATFGTSTSLAQTASVQIGTAWSNAARSADQASVQTQSAWSNAAASASVSASSAQGSWQSAAGGSSASWNGFFTSFNNSRPQDAASRQAAGVLGAWSGIAAAGRTIGAQAGEGLAAGLDSQGSRVTSASHQLADAAAAAMRQALAVHSPSRVAYGIGGYFGQGLADGIRSTIGVVHSASVAAANAAVNAASKLRSAGPAGASNGGIAIEVNGANDPAATAYSVSRHLSALGAV